MISSESERERAVDLAIAQIEKQFGKGSIMRLGGDEVVSNIPAISTGALSLDIALGVGGIPRGRIVEIYGPESGGKTTLALHVVAEAQKEGGLAAFIDAEHALDVTYARKIGVNTDDLLISQPDSVGTGPGNCRGACAKRRPSTYWSSTRWLPWFPVPNWRGIMGDAQMGLQARLMSQALRKLTGSINRSKTTGDFYQSAADENRHFLRESGDDDRRKRPEILMQPCDWTYEKPRLSSRDRT